MIQVGATARTTVADSQRHSVLVSNFWAHTGPPIVYKTIKIVYLGLVRYICTSRFLKFKELYFRSLKNLAVLRIEL